MSSANKAVSITLYRSLCRIVKHYTSPKHGAILCSLLYRNGLDEGIDFAKVFPPPLLKQSTSPPVEKKKNDNESQEHKGDADKREEDIQLTAEEARDLSRSYTELRQLHKEQKESLDSSYGYDSDEISYDSSMRPSEHIILYKRLLRKVLPNHMNFPSSILSDEDDNTMTRLRSTIREEFRSKSLEDNDLCYITAAATYSISHAYPDTTRRETAFLALRELEKKLSWAKSLGLQYEPAPGKDISTGNNNNDNTRQSQLHKIRRQAAKNVHALPKSPPSSYLRPGAFLVAHPLLTGCFSHSVICILEHTEPALPEASSSSDDNDKEDFINSIPTTLGGTYGLIVNKDLTVGVPSSDSRRRNRTLREIIRHNCLPESMKLAFGECAVRDGGPVNLSIQMIHAATADEEEKLKIGGSVLPMILADEDEDDGKSHEENEVNSVLQRRSPESAAKDTDKAVLYGGDIIKASKAVLNDEMECDDYSFLVGASCWEAGQLESEIQRGYWLPVRGPPQIALSGMCDHDVEDNDNQDSATKKSRPKSDLWLSMMCALGEKEGELANMLQSHAFDENGEACDDF